MKQNKLKDVCKLQNSKLNNVKIIDFDGNQLTKLPIIKFKSLLRLSLKKNKIKNLEGLK